MRRGQALLCRRLLLLLLPALLFFAALPLRASATEEERRRLPVQSDETKGWPEGPVTSAKAALVMDASTGVVLYAKNIHERMYPASTTKLMTALVAIENSSLSDNVFVSRNAIDLVPSDGVRIGMNAGESLTMEEALYCIIVGSANEVSNAIAEHTGGSVEGFADMMNEKAASLGLQGTHFSNPNGLHEDDHYTTAYDLALITRAYFEHVALTQIGGCPRYRLDPTAAHPNTVYMNNRHKMVTGEVDCEGVIGGKTGFTDEAGDCLVTMAERDGVRMICVVLFEKAPAQYTDTAALLEYGYGQFTRVPMAGSEKEVFPGMPDFYLPASSLFDRPVRTLSFAPGSMLTLPAGVTVQDEAVSYTVEAGDANAQAVLSYTFNGAPVGNISVIRTQNEPVGNEIRARTRFVNMRLTIRITILVLLAVALISGGAEGAYRHFTSRAYRQKRRLNRMKRQSKKNGRMLR